MPRKIFRFVGHQNVFMVSKVHSLYGQRGCDHRHAKGHALVDLAFDACPKSQRRDGQFYAIKKRANVFL